jgi:hypothetical protein
MIIIGEIIFYNFLLLEIIKKFYRKINDIINYIID